MKRIAVPEKSDKRLWWEKVKEGDESSMVGTWTGERSVGVRLKLNIGYIPTLHRWGNKTEALFSWNENLPNVPKVGGQVQGGGDWRKCENSKVSKGN